jgi:acyl-CoA thioester hydrolase
MRDDFKVWITVPVRWGDMDSMGHVNNAKFFTFCESARIRYFEVIRLHEFREHDRQGPAVVSATCNFRQQVLYPATLEVGVRASRMGGKSFTLEFEIHTQESDGPVADGTSVAVWVDYERGKALPLPDALRERIQRLDAVEG